VEKALDGQMNPVVIFDTATRLVYCEDVHGVIAAPTGSVVNYDYREKWVEPSCLAALQPGAPVVLVYCELPGFDRTVDAQFYWGAHPVPLETSFVTTRTAIIDSIRQEGGVYHFALCLGGYVSLPPLVLREFIANLPSRPGQHFVVQSIESWDSIWLLRSTGRDVWASVVDRIQLPDLQFKKDVFWRVESLKDRRTNRVIKPDTHGVFNVRTGRGIRILLASHIGKLAAPDLAWDVRRIRVDSQSESTLLVVKSRAEVGLRRTGETIVEVSFPVTAEWRKSTETLEITTDVEGALGSSAILNFSISHHPGRVLSAVALAGLAAVAALVATSLFKSEKIGEGVVFAAFGFLAGLLANRLMPLK
jgi:hypothetical protein